MEKSIIPAKTFVLKTNIHCKGCEKKMKKLLQSINGVHTITIDAAQEKVTISGTIDPHTVQKLLEKAGKKSELVWEPTNNLQIIDLESKYSQNNTSNNYHGIHDKDVVNRLQQLSEIKGLKSIELTRNRLKLTFRDGDNDCDVQDLHGHGVTCCARHSTSVMHGGLRNKYHGTCCARNCACSMCSGGSVTAGIPWTGSLPSAPPEVVPEYYDTPPPPPPPPPVMGYPYDTSFSDENPRACTIM